MLSIVKVLGCIISDAMVILGKAKGIFKDVEVWQSTTDLGILRKSPQWKYIVWVWEDKENRGWKDGQDPDDEELCVL